MWRSGSGFNPCCIGLAIAGRPADWAVIDDVLFQSLLYWISHCGPDLGGIGGGMGEVSILVVLD